jgi:Protein of unknown function (DUF935)
MPTFPQRIAAFFSALGGRISGIAGRTRGPEQSRVADLPLLTGGMGGGSGGGSRKPDDKTAAMLRAWGVYDSRISPLAGPTRDRYALWNATDLTPQVIAQAQYQAVHAGMPLQWVELIDHIFSRDIDYASVTNQRVADVMRGRWMFRRAGTDDAADISLSFAREATGGCSRWRDGLGWLLYSNLYSYNAVELEWKIDRIALNVNGKKVGPFEAALPARLHNVHPKHLRFDTITDDPLFWIGDGYQPLPLGKFVFMEGDGLHPIKVRHGHAWQCVWMSMFTSIGVAGWAQFVERFGLPIPKMEFDGDLAMFNEQKAAAQEILNAAGSAKGVMFPRGQFSLDYVQSPAGGRSSDPHSAFWDACKTAKVIRVLGAELANATGNVGSYAAKSQDIATKYNLEEWDAERLSERIYEQYTKPLILFNAENLATAANAAGFNVTPDELVRRAPNGNQEVVREMTLGQRVEVLGKLVSMGVGISEESELDKFGFTRATSDEDRIKGEGISVGKGASLKTPADAATGNADNPDDAALLKVKADAEAAKQPMPSETGAQGTGERGGPPAGEKE